MAAPLILFGAFDRHNLGDLLLAHMAARAAAARQGVRPLVFAGLAARDLRPWGGQRVRALAELARAWGDRPAELWHVGGEILTCSLYEAAVMTLPPEAAAAVVTRYDADPQARQAWAETHTGLRQQVGYLVPKTLFRRPGPFRHVAVGGVDLNALPQTFQAEVRARLTEADSVSVRDRITQANLAALGIHAALCPDPVEQVARMFGTEITRHAAGQAVADARARFPQGYLALQFSADFGDDATLRTLAEALDAFLDDSGWGLCLFRAGAAPWHDDAVVYRRFMRMLRAEAHLFPSLHVWDLCALLSCARGYCGSSLHGRIVARACGVPGVSLAHTADATSKVAAYAATWWQSAAPVSPTGLAGALGTALTQ